MRVRAIIAGVTAVAAITPCAQAPPAIPEGLQIVVLGVAQDAGIPQLGCDQSNCRSIREGTRAPERIASIGLVNRAEGLSYLFDATPDMVSQLDTLNGGRPPTAVFLTHGHIGHYTGLMFFGRESLAAKSVPVHGTERMAAYLSANGPWSQLVARKNIDLRVTPLVVPHRAVFVPDIDQWSTWSRSICELVDTVDLAFLDGTFASADELPGRSIVDIPHPLIPATRGLLAGTRARVWFIHLNHTNQELGAADVVRDRMTFVF